MTTPFSYHLYHKPTGKHYYGIKFAKGCSPGDLWTTYFSTSKVVKELIEQFGQDSFEANVRRTFSTAKEALHWEHKVLRRLHAAESANWINRHNGGSKFRGPITHSAESRAKFSAKLKGRVFTQEHLDRKSEAAKKHWVKRKELGQVQTPETARKGVITRTARISAGEIDPYNAERNAKMAASKRGTKRQYLPDGSYIMVRTQQQ